MGRDCRQLIEEKFKLQHQAEKYLELFNDLLKNRKTFSKGEKTRSISPGTKKIILDKWESVIQENFLKIYRENALDVLKKQDNQINFLNEQLKKRDEKILELYRSYTYRIGKIIVFPLKIIRTFYRKITGKNHRLFSKNSRNLK
jgi:hypothetical protein